MFPKFKRYDSPINGVLHYSQRWFGVWDLKSSLVPSTEYSGQNMKKIWNDILWYYKEDTVSRILILGTGAGCSTHIAHKFWPKAHIDSVDYDPAMFEVERDVYGLKSRLVRFIQNDALSFLNLKGEPYDLILVDLFVGSGVAPVVQTEDFTTGIKNKLSPTGNLIINIYNETPDGAMCSFLNKSFPELTPFQSLSNTLLVTPTRPIPKDFYEKSQSSLYAKLLKKHGSNLIRTKNNSNIVILSLFGFGIATTSFTDEEPDLKLIKQAGLRHGMIIWTPWKKRFKPLGWRESFFAIHYAGKGFAEVTPEYLKKWSPVARRDLKVFEKSGAHIEPTTREEFLAHLGRSTSNRNGRTVTKLLLNQMHDEDVTLWAAKKDGVVLATLSVINYDNHISHHLACYITREGMPLRAGTGLIDMWFRYALEHKIKYLDFGQIRQKFEPKEWAGYTAFKRKFLDHEIIIPRSFLKFF